MRGKVKESPRGPPPQEFPLKAPHTNAVPSMAPEERRKRQGRQENRGRARLSAGKGSLGLATARHSLRRGVRAWGTGLPRSVPLARRRRHHEHGWVMARAGGNTAFQRARTEGTAEPSATSALLLTGMTTSGLPHLAQKDAGRRLEKDSCPGSWNPRRVSHFRPRGLLQGQGCWRFSARAASFLFSNSSPSPRRHIPHVVTLRRVPRSSQGRKEVSPLGLPGASQSLEGMRQVLGFPLVWLGPLSKEV